MAISQIQRPALNLPENFMETPVTEINEYYQKYWELQSPIDDPAKLWTRKF